MTCPALSCLRRALGPILLTAVAVLTAAGCSRTPPVAYYQLAAMVTDNPAVHADAIGEAVIGIGPLRLPSHLERPQIVTRLDANRLQLADAHRWAEPLAENIAGVLRENLSVLLHTERFRLYPWSRAAEIDFQLVIDFVRFEGDGYQTAHLMAIWSIRDREGKIALPQRRSSYQVKTSAPDHEGLVRAQSRALAQFSSEIAQQLLQLAKKSGRDKP